MIDLRLPDRYALQARLMPVILVAVPVLFVAGGTIASGERSQIILGIVLAALTALGAQVGRDRGRGLEASLWTSWGGSPTLTRLRFRSSPSFEVTDQLHLRVSRVLGDQLPSIAEEQADQGLADTRYVDAVRRLRGLTRDQRRFALLFAENVNYGFRRNALGLRPIGIVVSAVVLGGSCALLALAGGAIGHRAALYGPGTAVSLMLLAFWVLTVTADWVRLPAESYADRLFEAADSLSQRLPLSEHPPERAERR